MPLAFVGRRRRRPGPLRGHVPRASAPGATASRPGSCRATPADEPRRARPHRLGLSRRQPREGRAGGEGWGSAKRSRRPCRAVSRSAAGEDGLAGALLEEALRRRCGCPRCRRRRRSGPARAAGPRPGSSTGPPSMAALAKPCTSSGPLASSAASAKARSCSSSWGTTSSARPMRSASSASTWRPVRIMSLARAGPTSRGRRCVPPAPGDDAEQDLGLAEDRLLRGDAEVAGQRQLAPAAQRVARRRRRSPCGGWRRRRPARPGCRRRAARASGGPRPTKPVMSAPAAKIRSPPVTTTAPGGSAISVSAVARQLGDQRARQRVDLRVVEGDDGDPVVASFEADQGGLVAHARNVVPPLPSKRRASFARIDAAAARTVGAAQRRQAPSSPSITSAAAHGSMRRASTSASSRS